MRNIYQMISIVIGTTEQRMDKAILEVFDKLTEHYKENRFMVEGWRTNSHYLVNRRFIFPYGAEKHWSRDYVTFKHYSGNGEQLVDMEKALCYITGENFDTINGMASLPNEITAGQWNLTHFFKIRCYKKGTVHCEFISEDVWGRFNSRVAKLKGYPLFEHVETKDTVKHDKETAKRYRPTVEPKVLSTIKLKVA